MESSNKYNHSEIESKWQKAWQKSRIYEPDLIASRRTAKKPFYNLMMFPYPSAEGLHVGNVYAFVGSDIYGRFKRMQGLDVFEPIGLDGFGIHSENFALKIGAHPMKQAKISEKRFYDQLSQMGNSFAWKEHLETYDPNYYKWTQWIFVQLFKKGLAYRKKSPVNWCPSCMTVLADEQVLDSKCERCGTEVIKKDLEQWFFKITAYAERLLKNLDHIDWSEKVKVAQRNWIGKSEGSMIKFPISNSQFSIDVFTTRADTLFGATYMVLSPEHPLIESLKSQITNYQDVEEYIKKARGKSLDDRAKSKTGVVLRGVKAINPATKESIPVWISDYVLMGYGTGAIMVVPAHDERDFEFAKKFGLTMQEVVSHSESKFPKKVYAGEGRLINSGHFNGMDSETARKEVTRFVKGKWQAQYRLRDWLISRQRYWGPPIPMIYCGSLDGGCGWQAVPEKDLPVRLPFIKNFRPTGTDKSPLAGIKSFYKVKCPKCKKWARRETDVSDTFLDSAWYYIGYLMKSGNWKLGFGNSAFAKLTRRWLPVNMYIGGAEHAVLHLLYSRFLTMALHDIGALDFSARGGSAMSGEEPFTRFRAHGLIIKDGAKMSKSKGNIVNPDEYIKMYGADTLRTYLMFAGPFSQGGDFRDEGVSGITRFLNRILKLREKVRGYDETASNPVLLHKTIKKVTQDIEFLRYNTAISALMILVNDFESRDVLSKIEYDVLLKLMAPFAPHLVEELWQDINEQKFSKKNSVHLQSWPNYDPEQLKEDTYVLVIQINGKVRGKVRVSAGISEEEAKEGALKQVFVRPYLEGKEMEKFIFVPGRLINFVLR